MISTKTEIKMTLPLVGNVHLKIKKVKVRGNKHLRSKRNGSPLSLAQ